MEKKNYDDNHRYRGKTKDTEFKRRMELFFDSAERRGLDWQKCMRKLKRRCCDLLRYDRINVLKQGAKVKQSTQACDYISLIGSLAQESLTQIHQRESSQGNLSVKRNDN